MNKREAIKKAKARSESCKEPYFVVKPRLCKLFAICREPDLYGIYSNSQIVAKYENGRQAATNDA